MQTGNDYIFKTTDEWANTSAANIIIPRGCLCIEKLDENTINFKIGDGTHKYSETPTPSSSPIDLTAYATKTYVAAVIADIDVDPMTGATATTAGTAGTVPAPSAGDNTKYLRGDGTWETPAGGGGSVTVDTALSTTSTNPVQNKVTTAGINTATTLATHTNRTILDATTASYTTADKSKLDGVATNANKYIHPSYSQHDSGLYKVAIDETGHVYETTAVSKTDITTLGIPAQDTKYSIASDTVAGLIKSGGDITISTEGVVSVVDNSHNHTVANVTGLQTKLDEKLNTSLKGATGGLAELDSNGTVPSSQLPSYVDDIIDGYLNTTDNKFYSDTAFITLIVGESGKIYVDVSTNKTYRWSGTNYVPISETITLGETSTTAYRGDRGKIAYDHSQLITGNPHNVTAIDVGLGDVENKSSSTIRSEITSSDVTTALGFTPADTDDVITTVATPTEDGLFGSVDKAKLDTISTGANKYIHPTYDTHSSNMYKVTVDDTGHISATVPVTKNDIIALGISESGGTTYDVATHTTDGLMSATDKTKLDTVEENANAYIHPTYTTDEVSSLRKTKLTNGHVSETTAVTKADITNLGIPAQDTTYTIANDTTTGLIKSGGDISVDATGVVSVVDNSHNHTIENVTGLQTALDLKIDLSTKGTANGIAELDENGKVLTSQLPSYVDDVIDGYFNETDSLFYKETTFTTPIVGESSKIYVDIATDKTYRWSGTVFAPLSSSVVLGETSTTAYRGDRGKIAYDHTLITSGNPHNVTAADVGLGDVENKSSSTIRSEITSSNVTTALGFTPADASKVVTSDVATETSNGLMASTDKVKLNTIETGANKYMHPTRNPISTGLYKFSINDTGHVDEIVNINKADITALGIPAQDTTYDVATDTVDGLMSSTDKAKLNTVSENANNYIHPTYEEHVSGLYKIANDDTGHITGVTAVTKADITNLGIPDENTTYTVASESLGLIKSGGDISIDTTGVVSVVDNSHNHTIANVSLLQDTLDAKIGVSMKGVANGIAELDENGKVLSTQLPSYVDDVIDGYFNETDSLFYKEDTFTTPIAGESGKIYVDVSTNKTYRWSGTVFAPMGSSIALGETSTTAYRGDRGKIAYDHSQLITGNPHNVTAADVGLGNVENKVINDLTPTYITGDANTELTSGEKISVAFGKIAKIVSSVISHIADVVSHITAAERTEWNAKQDALSAGTTTTLGTTKLYTATGTGTDGALTQNAITTLLAGKAGTLSPVVRTIASTGWVASTKFGSTFCATVAVTAVTASNHIIVVPTITESSTEETVAAIKNLNLEEITQTDGNVNIYISGTAPTVGIPITILVLG